MNKDQILSIVRQILLFGGGFLVAKGYIDTTTLTAVVGALATLIASAWAIYTRTDSAKLDAAAEVPGVTKIVAGQDLAASTTSDKVVAR